MSTLRFGRRNVVSTAALLALLTLLGGGGGGRATAGEAVLAQLDREVRAKIVGVAATCGGWEDLDCLLRQVGLAAGGSGGDGLHSLLQRVGRSPAALSIPRLAIASHGSFEVARSHIAASRPVILTGVPAAEAAGAEGASMAAIRQVLEGWTAKRRSQYFEGGPPGGRGENGCHTHNFSAAPEDWPWPGRATFSFQPCQAFGSFGWGGAAVESVINLLDSAPGAPNGRVPSLHTDNNCHMGFAVQVSGAKLYWTQAPAANLTEAARAAELARFYKSNNNPVSQPIRGPIPSDDARYGLWSDYAGVLQPGEVLLFSFWTPHIGLPLVGHAWTFNGYLDIIASTNKNNEEDNVGMRLIEESQPSPLAENCRLRREILGEVWAMWSAISSKMTSIHIPGRFSQRFLVQPWDKEWAGMKEELYAAKVAQAGLEELGEIWGRHSLAFRWRVCSLPDEGRSVGALPSRCAQ